MSDQVNWKELSEAAIAVRKNAWAPYSKFQVGAALWVDNQIFVGCNVENVSYPVGMCAERSAIGAMIAAGFQHPQALAIAAGPLITPCGMCRQALLEFSATLPVLLIGQEVNEQVHTNLETLLPSPFSF